MTNLNRRQLLKIAGASALATPALTFGATAQVVVVGGGAAGTVAARHIAAGNPDISVTLIERRERYHSGLASSQTLGGLMSANIVQFGYEALVRAGINVVQDVITSINAEQRVVLTASGKSVSYDRLVLAPGVSLERNTIDGYNEETALRMPHAWHDQGQTTILRQQIQSMGAGGTVIIAVPAGPISSPSAPYTRASRIAHYLKQNNPTAKVLVCDTKPDFPMSDLFRAAWQELYPGMIEWVSGQDTGGDIQAIDAGSMQIIYPLQTFSADVANVILPQSAGSLATAAGVCDTGGWCPVDITTFQSVRQPGIHIIGDSTQVDGLPKSAQIANSQAKACAQAIVSNLTDAEPGAVRFIDVDYSVVGNDYAFSTVTAYRPNDAGDGVQQISSQRSSLADPRSRRSRDYAYALSWYNNISQEMFG